MADFDDVKTVGQTRWFKMTVAYDGSNYAGWQIQPGKPTVQGMLERALARITKRRIRVTGSGRTDAGVHALAQVASLSIDGWNGPASALAAAMNTKLDDEISVLRVEEAVPDFHAIRDARGKRYRYQLQIGGVRDAFDFRYRHRVPFRMDLDSVRQAMRRIVGRQDFACFQAVGAPRKTTVRDVRVLQLIDQNDTAGGLASNPEISGNRFAIEIAADGFLYNMVRNIVGTLIEVGRGKKPAEWIDQLIAARDRKLAGPTAPARGLFLHSVHYDESVLFTAADSITVPSPPAASGTFTAINPPKESRDSITRENQR